MVGGSTAVVVVAAAAGTAVVVVVAVMSEVTWILQVNSNGLVLPAQAFALSVLTERVGTLGVLNPRHLGTSTGL